MSKPPLSPSPLRRAVSVNTIASKPPEPNPWVKLRRCLLKETVDVVLIRQLAMARERRAALEYIESGAADVKSYKHQGDHTMYSCASMQKRALLKTHPEIRQAINAIWRHATSHLPSGQKIIRKEVYVCVLSVVRRTLLPSKEYKSSQDRWRVEREWYVDLQRSKDACFPAAMARRLFVAADKLDQFNAICAISQDAMTYPQFFNSVFEVVDMWCASADASEYAAMAGKLLRAIKRELKSSDLRQADVGLRLRGRPGSANTGVKGFGSTLPRNVGSAGSSRSATRSPSPAPDSSSKSSHKPVRKSVSGRIPSTSLSPQTSSRSLAVEADAGADTPSKRHTAAPRRSVGVAFRRSVSDKPKHGGVLATETTAVDSGVNTVAPEVVTTKVATVTLMEGLDSLNFNYPIPRHPSVGLKPKGKSFTGNHKPQTDSKLDDAPTDVLTEPLMTIPPQHPLSFVRKATVSQRMLQQQVQQQSSSTMSGCENVDATMTFSNGSKLLKRKSSAGKVVLPHDVFSATV